MGTIMFGKHRVSIDILEDGRRACVWPIRATYEFTAIIEQDEGWYIAYSPEIPGANGQGRSREECIESLAEAIKLILEDRREDGLRGVPPEATQEIIVVQ